MTPDIIRFFVEMLASPQERIFLNALWDNPKDEAALAAYGDWLEEQGRGEGAKLIRKKVIPGVLVSMFGGMIGSGSIASGQIGNRTW